MSRKPTNATTMAEQPFQGRESATDRAARKEAAATAKADRKTRQQRAASTTRAARKGQQWEENDRQSDRGSGWRISFW